MIGMVFDVFDDVFMMAKALGTTFVLTMKLSFAQKVIKNHGVLHLFLMDLWMIGMTFDVFDDIF